mmetsp:Transcript_9491/g.27133  ORF Transcript_9491/g.27133 Transcript_9491/m.27133 type:complete len:242 (+) Transcript_9491:1728-2453(+)
MMRCSFSTEAACCSRSSSSSRAKATCCSRSRRAATPAAPDSARRCSPDWLPGIASAAGTSEPLGRAILAVASASLIRVSSASSVPSVDAAAARRPALPRPRGRPPLPPRVIPAEPAEGMTTRVGIWMAIPRPPGPLWAFLACNTACRGASRSPPESAPSSSLTWPSSQSQKLAPTSSTTTSSSSLSCASSSSSSSSTSPMFPEIASVAMSLSIPSPPRTPEAIRKRRRRSREATSSCFCAR